MSAAAVTEIAPAGAALIRAEGLSVAYGPAAPILHDIDFTMRAGEIVTVVGPNGAGKSTFLRALLGMIAPGTGRVWRAPGLRLGYVPQRLHLDSNLPLSVARFLRLVQPLSRETVQALLERVGVPGLADRPMAALSGGQFQRVLLAQALAGQPQLLVLDEPTQGLDQPGVAAFYRLIEDLRRDMGCAVLSVSHDLHVVMSASDRVICLNGHICCEGTPTVVSNAPEYRALFGLGTQGALALYQHHHDHDHDRPGKNSHFCDHDHSEAEGARHDP
ncbi:MAG: ABC-type zinc uptake system ATPase component ZnuC [Rhodobacteraceae bacterium HLUCCA12]|nr:MAG: ABC-type zinc uptake system ATPase component ZnuC [Rhodobacteraceae bacterium HLUCCA12]